MILEWITSLLTTALSTESGTRRTQNWIEQVAAAAFLHNVTSHGLSYKTAKQQNSARNMRKVLIDER